MPKVTVNDKTFEVERGERLVLALERNGIALGHRCGGQARCTTCRVQFVSGEPDTMTQAEYNRLYQRDLLGKARLSCQIEVNEDMSVIPLVLVADNPDWQGDPGPEPEEIVEPEAVWYPMSSIQTE